MAAVLLTPHSHHYGIIPSKMSCCVCNTKISPPFLQLSPSPLTQSQGPKTLCKKQKLRKRERVREKRDTHTTIGIFINTTATPPSNKYSAGIKTAFHSKCYLPSLYVSKMIMDYHHQQALYREAPSFSPVVLPLPTSSGSLHSFKPRSQFLHCKKLTRSVLLVSTGLRAERGKTLGFNRNNNLFDFEQLKRQSTFFIWSSKEFPTCYMSKEQPVCTVRVFSHGKLGLQFNLLCNANIQFAKNYIQFIIEYYNALYVRHHYIPLYTQVQVALECTFQQSV